MAVSLQIARKTPSKVVAAAVMAVGAMSWTGATCIPPRGCGRCPPVTAEEKKGGEREKKKVVCTSTKAKKSSRATLHICSCSTQFDVSLCAD